MKKFEYDIVEIPMDKGPYNDVLKKNERYIKSSSDLVGILMSYGESGWEFCCVWNNKFFLKREIVQ